MKDLYIGGLMRCCTGTLHEYIDNGGTEEEGTVVQCKYVPLDPLHQIEVRDGAWRWVGPENKDIKPIIVRVPDR